MRDFDDFDIGPQCDEYGDDYPFDDDDPFYGYPPAYSASFFDDDDPFYGYPPAYSASFFDDDDMPF